MPRNDAAISRVERVRRRAYLTAAGGAVAAHVFIVAEQLLRRDWANAAAFTLGMLVSAWVVVALAWLRWPTARLSGLIVAVVTVSTTAEFVPLLRAPEIGTGSFLSFLIMVALWFGLLPLRAAVPATLVAYLLFAGLAASRPTHDLSLLAYLACTTIVIGMASSFGQQITAFQQDAVTFEQAALTDPLTELPNRRAALERLRHLHALVQRGEHAGFTLVLLDLDHFKQVNDTRGHAVGDEVLRALGPALRQVLRADALLARWGGEEFVLVIPGTGAQEARVVTARLDGLSLRLPVPLPEMTFSAGAVLAHEADSVAGLLDLADRRLYAAKRAGRRQLRWDAAGGSQHAS
ncbi:diguanylate cyclase [Deinococcus grandis]|uniref:Diguanylate cyclase n=1 Tax=Deinococcus grandis TaxID=57498 RepID=A0A100HJ88_9DEIO|nr:GGDEF domain-containing protein [Deinococcus grandis]BBN96113.1 GGDEF domain-containing protein [Deinococcus grandis]GAQ20405.1 diguanylate cyclase [Deinococcus grandis]